MKKRTKRKRLFTEGDQSDNITHDDLRTGDFVFIMEDGKCIVTSSIVCLFGNVSFVRQWSLLLCGNLLYTKISMCLLIKIPYPKSIELLFFDGTVIIR